MEKQGRCPPHADRNASSFPFSPAPVRETPFPIFLILNTLHRPAALRRRNGCRHKSLFLRSFASRRPSRTMDARAARTAQPPSSPTAAQSSRARISLRVGQWVRGARPRPAATQPVKAGGSWRVAQRMRVAHSAPHPRGRFLRAHLPCTGKCPPVRQRQIQLSPPGIKPLRPARHVYARLCARPCSCTPDNATARPAAAARVAARNGTVRARGRTVASAPYVTSSRSFPVLSPGHKCFALTPYGFAHSERRMRRGARQSGLRSPAQALTIGPGRRLRNRLIARPEDRPGGRRVDGAHAPQTNPLFTAAQFVRSASIASRRRSDATEVRALCAEDASALLAETGAADVRTEPSRRPSRTMGARTARRRRNRPPRQIQGGRRAH